MGLSFQVQGVTIIICITDHEGQTRTTDSRKSNGDTKEWHALFKAMTSVNLKFEVGTDGTIEVLSRKKV